MKIRAKEVVLWRNKDVLRTSAFAFPNLLSLVFILYSVAVSFPKMSLSKKKKVDKQCRVFQTVGPFPIFFTEVNGIPVCLVCSQQVQW